MKSKVWAILFLAIVVRLLFVFPQYSGDVKNHLTWADSTLSHGPFGLYQRHFPGYNDVNYPPVSIMLFSGSRLLYQGVSSIIHWQNFHAKFIPSAIIPFIESENAAAGFMKLPSILADVLIGFLIFLIAKKNHQSHPLLLASLYWFNPAVIYISSVWGQIESLPLLFLAASFFLVQSKKKSLYWLSHLCFILAVLSKQTALWLLPVYLIIWLQQGDFGRVVKGLLLQILVFFIIFLPFAWPVDVITTFISALSGSSKLISDQAFNLWFLIFKGQRLDDSVKLLGAPVRLWSLGSLAVVYLFVCLRLWQRKSIEFAANSLFLLSLTAFFLQTRVHERHLAPALLFLLLTSYCPKTKITLYLVLSVYHFANLYTGLRLPFI